MSRPDPEALKIFEQFAHELGNPLMIISGHAFLVYRHIERLPDLPDDERQALLDVLAEIARTVTTMAAQLEQHHASLTAALDVAEKREDGPVDGQDRDHGHSEVRQT